MVRKFLRSVDTRSVKSLIQGIKKYPRITDEIAIQLAKAAKAGSEKARNELVNSTMWRVVSIALYYYNLVPSVELEDMIQNGSIGLLNAIEKYNPELETSFFMFCSYSIKAGIIDGINNESRTIRVPHGSYKICKKIKLAEDRLFQQNGYYPTPAQIAEELGEKESRISALMNMAVASYDSDEMYESADYIAADYEDADQKDYNKMLVSALVAQQPETRRYIISNIYGLDEGLEMDLKTIGERVDLSRERVRQIKVAVLDDMRRKLAA